MNFEDLLPKRISIRKPTQADLHFIVIGAGGTGGYLMRDLVRIISLENEKTERMHSRDRSQHGITLIDGDVVEEKNLGRQNFVSQDIGKNKADVIASRYGRAFRHPVNVIPEFLTSPNELVDYIFDLRNSSNRTSDRYLLPVFIDCVDNNATRLYIAAAVATLANQHSVSSYTISSGNSERTGQVLISAMIGAGNETLSSDLKSVIEHNGSHENPSLSVNTPSFFDVFPNIEIDKDPTQLSCAEQAESAPQNIVTNMNAANIVFGFAMRLLNHEFISTIAIFYDTNTGKQSEIELSIKDLNRLLSMTPENPNMSIFLPEEELSRGMYRSEVREKIYENAQTRYTNYVEEQVRLLKEAEANALAMFEGTAEQEVDEEVDEETPLPETESRQNSEVQSF